MFQQVDVTIRLAGRTRNDLLVSYVVSAPMWKPTYRVVLPEAGKGQALLQGWAVVDNTSGEDWRDVKLALTSGAPIAFRYDLHTPRDVVRTDLSAVGTPATRASVAVGEAGYGQPAPAPPPRRTGLRGRGARLESRRQAEKKKSMPASREREAGPVAQPVIGRASTTPSARRPTTTTRGRARGRRRARSTPRRSRARCRRGPGRRASAG